MYFFRWKISLYTNCLLINNIVLVINLMPSEKKLTFGQVSSSQQNFIYPLFLYPNVSFTYISRRPSWFSSLIYALPITFRSLARPPKRGSTFDLAFTMAGLQCMVVRTSWEYYACKVKIHTRITLMSWMFTYGVEMHGDSYLKKDVP